MKKFFLFIIGITIGISAVKHYYIDRQIEGVVVSARPTTEGEVKASVSTFEPDGAGSANNNIDEIENLIETPVPTLTDVPESTPTETAVPVNPSQKPSLTKIPTVTKLILPTATSTPLPSPTTPPTSAPTTTPTSTLTPNPSPTTKPVARYSSQEINGFIDRFAGQYAVDPNVLRHIAVCESGFNPLAISRNGLYAGLFQFSSSAWFTYRQKIGENTSPDLRFDAEEAVQTAAYVLSIGMGRIWPNCLP